MSDESAQHSSDILDLNRPGIIEASAGTGKTYSIAEIYLSLLCGHRDYPHKQTARCTSETHPNPPSVKEILVVTFTEAATNELTDRLQKRIREAIKTELPPDASEQLKNERRLLQLADAEFDEAAVSTIHGFCIRVLRDFSFECGLPPSLVPTENLSEEMLRFAARFRIREVLCGNTRLLELSTEKIKRIIDKLAKNPDITVAEPSNGDLNSPTYYTATRGLKAWIDERQKAEQLSFDEVLLRLRDALRETPTLAKKISSRYRVALVDEFQDTDPVQWEIFKLIFINQNRPLFCVGDPKQAIYEFRGGDIHTYRRATEEILKKSNGNRLRLTTNWRSSANMVAAFNELFGCDNQIEALEGVTVGGNLEYCEALPSPKAKDDSIGEVPAIFLRTGFGGTVANARIAVEQRLTEDIKNLITNQSIPPEAIAVLVNKNKEALSTLKALSRAGIPAVMCATGSVLESEEAVSLRDLLEAILNPRSTSVVRRAAACEYFGKRFFDALKQTDSSENPDIAQLRESFFDAQKTWERKGILAAFARLEKTYAFGENLSTLSESSRRLANMRHVLEILQNEAHVRRLAPQALFKRFDQMLQSPNPDSESEALRIDSDMPAVKITTLHKSKGLQYEIVFLPNLWDRHLNPKNNPRNKPFSSRQKKQDGTQQILLEGNSEFENISIEENAQTEACVAYVAFTRAKHACIVYHADKATFYRKKIDSYLSKILPAAGISGGNAENSPKHWHVLTTEATLPPIPLPLKSESTHRNSPQFLTPSAETNKSAWDIFSFSKIIGDHSSSQPGKIEAETPEPEKKVESDSNASEIFPAPGYYDLPAGKEFGTLVHAIFEEIDFRTKNNLDALLDAYRERFPQWLSNEPSREKFKQMFKATLELPVDGKSAKLSEIDVSRDSLRELEFFFHVKESENLYSKLNNIFSSWDGIYKRTAEIHWSNGESGNLKIEGLMHGYIDLVARSNGRYFVADWKTNRVMKKEEKAMSRKNLEEEIAECGYALQWTIYAVALRKYLRKTMGEKYSTDQHFGGIAYFFVRWNVTYFDDSLDDAKLDAIENILIGANAQ